MFTRAFDLKGVGEVVVEPLRNGDVETVADFFGRLSEESRRKRFCGAKPRLSSADLACLARVDAGAHALVARVGGEPVGFAQLVRDAAEWTSAEIAFAVADEWHGKGIGTLLVDELAADARAGGITHLTATILTENPAALTLVKRVARPVALRLEGAETVVLAALTTAPA